MDVQAFISATSVQKASIVRKPHKGNATHSPQDRARPMKAHSDVKWEIGDAQPTKARFGCAVVDRFELWEAAVEARSSNCEFGRDRCTDNGGPPFTAHRLQASPLLGQATCG